MNKKQLEKLKKLLLTEKQSVVRHLTELKGESEETLEQGSGDSADIANLEISQASLQKLGSREQKHLKKIDRALAKFEAGDYGVCEECGEEISYARLEARPIAQLCIDCKTVQEQRERQYTDATDDDSDDGGYVSEDGEEASD